jgi:hypothetical protein
MRITIDIGRDDLDEVAVARIMDEIGQSMYTMENFVELQDGSFSLETSYGKIYLTPENNLDNSPRNN